jgi:hypothetical protein
MAFRSRVRWNEAYIYDKPDGTTVHDQTENVGYGFSNYMIVGTLEGVLQARKDIETRYPKIAYGGYYPEPFEVAPGLYFAHVRHSNTCD